MALFLRFLRFGLLAWGGPVPQIAMLRRELVDEEHWIPSDRFNRLLAVYQVLPGPEAHELAVHMGLLRGGRVGAVLAGLGFMLPGFVLVLALAWLYTEIGLAEPALGAAFLGIQVAVIALLVRAVHRIGSHVLLNPALWLIAIGAGAATFAGVSFWVTLPVAGATFILADSLKRFGPAVLALVVVVAAIALASAWLAGTMGLVPALVTGAGTSSPTPVGEATQPTLAALLLSGLKAGLLTFGGAYTAIPFVRGDAVGNGWLTDAQFLDGLALSGIVPAPLVIFATFVGFVAGGPLGAVAMTVGIFLPAFSFSVLFGDRIEAVVANPTLHTLLEGVAAGVVGIIAVTALELGWATAGRLPSIGPGIVIFVGALVALYRLRAPTAILGVVGASAAAGWLLFGGPAAL